MSRYNHATLSVEALAVFRTKICEEHQLGKCRNPDRCQNSHCQTWQRRNPLEHPYSAKLCSDIKFVVQNNKMTLVRRCARGRSCFFAHSKEEELYHPSHYKTKPCSFHPYCTRYYCPFLHGIEELSALDDRLSSAPQYVRSMKHRSNAVEGRMRKNLEIPEITPWWSLDTADSVKALKKCDSRRKSSTVDIEDHASNRTLNTFASSEPGCGTSMMPPVGSSVSALGLIEKRSNNMLESTKESNSKNHCPSFFMNSVKCDDISKEEPSASSQVWEVSFKGIKDSTRIPFDFVDINSGLDRRETCTFVQKDKQSKCEFNLESEEKHHEKGTDMMGLSSNTEHFPIFGWLTNGESLEQHKRQDAPFNLHRIAMELGSPIGTEPSFFLHERSSKDGLASDCGLSLTLQEVSQRLTQCGRAFSESEFDLPSPTPQDLLLPEHKISHSITNKSLQEQTLDELNALFNHRTSKTGKDSLTGAPLFPIDEQNDLCKMNGQEKTDRDNTAVKNTEQVGLEEQISRNLEVYGEAIKKSLTVSCGQPICLPRLETNYVLSCASSTTASSLASPVVRSTASSSGTSGTSNFSGNNCVASLNSNNDRNESPEYLTKMQTFDSLQSYSPSSFECDDSLPVSKSHSSHLFEVDQSLDLVSGRSVGLSRSLIMCSKMKYDHIVELNKVSSVFEPNKSASTSACAAYFAAKSENELLSHCLDHALLDCIGEMLSVSSDKAAQQSVLYH